MTTGWSAVQLELIDRADELQMATQRADGTLRRWVPIWVVQPLAPRADRGRLTILDMRNCADAEDYAGRAETWAHEIWRTWAHEQDTIRNLVSTVL